MLEPLHIPDAPPTRQFLAFPMGITGSDLNICSYAVEDNLDFEFSADPVASFATPILQITSSRTSTTDANTSLAVRTFGSTVLFRVGYVLDSAYVDLTESATITREDTGQRPSVDVKYHPKESKVLFVNDEGCVYKLGFEDGQRQVMILNQLAFSGIKNPVVEDKFWQLAIAGESEDGCLLSSSTEVHELDFRAANSALNLLAIAGTTNETLTWVGDSGDDFLVPLTSTERILWLDRRFPGKPLLGIKHRRNHDRTLAAHSVTIRGHPHYLMTSRKNRLVTVYDVSRSTEQLLHANNPPYSFSVDTRESRFSGDACVSVRNHHKLFRLTERGTIVCADLMQNDGDETAASVAALEYLPRDTPDMRPNLGHVGAQEFSRTNLRPAYEQIFPSVIDNVVQEEANAEAFHDLIDHLPSFWQQQDSPIEEILTATLLQGRLPIQTLIDGASWSFNIASILKHFDESTAGDIGMIAERFRSFDLDRHPDDPVQASRRQNKAREQLALDLTLSKNIFSPRKFIPSSQPVTSGHADGDSSVHFHFLQPSPRRQYYSKEEQQDDVLVLPSGVGLLLQDWDIGADPDKYIFTDISDIGADSNTQARSRDRIDRGYTEETPPKILLQSQVPPPIAAKPVAQPVVLPSRLLGVESQSQMTELAEAESQNVMMSTQVLPGPFGGRPTAIGKKKAGKKRNKAVVTALSASCISTFAGYPLDSLKSRLQTTKTPISVPRLALIVYREEGISGFYRGLAIPLLTISFVRAASFTIYNSTKDHFKKREWLARDSIIDVSVIGGISGAMSGALISVGSTRKEFAFELVKVRRQLEYSIASSKGIHLAKAPGTLEAVRDIFRTSGIAGLYTGFKLHLTRDTTGTMLYFMEYDGMRYLLGRQRSGEQGPIPSWIPIPVSLAPFVCGSFAGVSNFLGLDISTRRVTVFHWLGRRTNPSQTCVFRVKTKVQQRALAGERYRGPFETFYRLIRGPDPSNPKPFLAGVARIYRGLGVSAVRSITTHGLLWTFFDLVANYIDNLPTVEDQ
ncbi:mitochondrial carrier domain-containing protein [Lentinula raphanica]|nr:mitochondrial carrier domain-containing protein [Lentinula raphanica]